MRSFVNSSTTNRDTNMTKIRTDHTTDDPAHVRFDNPEPTSHPDPYKQIIEQMQTEISELRQTVQDLSLMVKNLNQNEVSIRNILQSQNESTERFLTTLDIQKDSINLLKNIAVDHGHIHRDLIDTVKDHGKTLETFRKDVVQQSYFATVKWKTPSFLKRLWSKIF